MFEPKCLKKVLHRHFRDYIDSLIFLLSIIQYQSLLYAAAVDLQFTSSAPILLSLLLPPSSPILLSLLPLLPTKCPYRFSRPIATLFPQRMPHVSIIGFPIPCKQYRFGLPWSPRFLLRFAYEELRSPPVFLAFRSTVASVLTCCIKTLL